MRRKGFSKGFINIEDLYLAYRKAKAEAFFDNMHPCALAFTEYEKHLERNLDNLFHRLTAPGANWFSDCNFIGDYIYIPKSLDLSMWETASDDIYYRAINPLDDWEQRFQSSGSQKLDAKYRLLITAKVDYQIISALWILKIGHWFEFMLNKDWSYGNRLRRNNPNSSMQLFQNGNGQLNMECSGLFSPYFSGYQSWRENGLKTMRESVKEGKSINAITMDLASFYHNVGPKFILREAFLDEIGIRPSEDERLFTEQLIKSIDTWYQSTPDSKSRPEGALPVGLSASKILSNILLYQFDKEVLASLNPLYYGRYVDDIFLVTESTDATNNGQQVLDWIASSVDCLELEEKGTIKVNLPYANDSRLIFSGDKQKIFSLSTEHGLDFIDQISDQIRKQSSEHRLLPEVPETATEMASKALLATPSASLNADALRKADVVSIRRLGFSLLLRDIESYARDLRPQVWSSCRHEFYGLVHRHLLNPQGLFEFTNYCPRIFGLMIRCGDFDDATQFVEEMVNCFHVLANTTSDGTAGGIKKFSCQSYFVKVLVQAGLQASTAKGYKSFTQLGRVLRQLFAFDATYRIPSKAPSLKKVSEALLLADWGGRPYKDYWYYSQAEDINVSKVPRRPAIREIIRLNAVREFQKFAQLKQPHWLSLAFPTRPLSIQEMLIIAPRLLEDQTLFRQSILGLRGAKVGDQFSLGVQFRNSSELEKRKYLNVPRSQKQKKVKVALTSLETTDKQWSSVVSGRPDRSLNRYQRIFGLVNLILKEKEQPDYVVFPECSIPRRWAFSMAQKLARNGISLICGLEYYVEKKGRKKLLRSDCFISMTTPWPGYASSIIYMQPKLAPSHGEREKLKERGREQWLPKAGIKGLPIYNHGGYYFGILICSDMTNIESRAHFQGKVDSLFVLEWNPDITTFSFLVESAAQDLHTFVIQVNNRMYGDSRIRAPYKEDYERDSVRIKGGLTDFYVIGDIDFMGLRRFQRSRKKYEKPKFKPLPIGFEMSRQRKKNL